MSCLSLGMYPPASCYLGGGRRFPPEGRFRPTATGAASASWYIFTDEDLWKDLHSYYSLDGFYCWEPSAECTFWIKPPRRLRNREPIKPRQLPRRIGKVRCLLKRRAQD